MEFGVTMFPTDRAISPADLGREAEARGFESLFLPEHSHIPVSRRSPWPGGPELPEEYKRTHDPFVALAMVAAVTERLRVGTGICLVVQRDPITTAKEVASLDALSGGRFLFGIGAGWNREEMADHGTDARTRMTLLDERVAAMKAIWTQDEASYHGRFVDFDPMWSWPKPAQRPHPPVLVGGSGPTVLDRVLAVGDEWMPIRIADPEELARRIAELQRRAHDIGRARVPVTLFGAPRDPAALERLAEIGVTRAVLPLRPVGRDDLLPTLDRDAGLLDRFAP
ncbi:MAG TPA: LLM class F420-dependent oxidoreductase [Acidimicrobiales bacterium]|nr:LLM class F420-dependent oxidoreductase [Acidimicrobiales bacterium]